ncbi:helix-turn-helix domain-containing protein [Aquiflexum gelatinilyticum]|uniref:helix-turn-helix domain-containing protein n=1 Tax=Aquiflexum gelatinilyticum TaxID=2961943 RepID=UPI0021671259|nr:helix-turn-helix transcriptional regulator [Aquiflexum gelatinilyticum]MCS4434213.1 helix-turn-helix domain-containing protein [Aquiflexum gelatinilyticum]
MEDKDDNGFTVLENKNIGRNLATFRKLRDRKAMEVAEHLGLKEAAYTKYERGESQITIDLIQKVAEFLNVDPLQIVSANPGYVIEHLTNSPFSITGNVKANYADKNQTEVMMKMMETMMQMNEAIKKILEGR